MKKIALMIFVSLLSFCTYGQLALEGFETPWTGIPGAPPGGWAVYNQAGNITWVQSTAGFTQTPPYAGNHAAYLNRENVLPSAPIPTNWLISPQFNSPVNGQLHFYSRMNYPGDNGSIFKIRITTVTDPLIPVAELPWVDLVPQMGELEMNPIQQTYTEKTFNIPAVYVGQQVRIAFIMQGDDQERWLIDNVEVVSFCNAPTTLAATGITLNSATLSWNSPAGITSWEIELRPESEAFTYSGINYSGTLPYPATSLLPNTTYKYNVRSLCSDGGKSTWTGPYTFKTPAIGSLCNNPLIIPAALPYVTTNNTINFDDLYEGIPGTGCNAAGNYLSGNDVIYSYTPTTSGTINISLSNTGGNAGLFVYGSCNAIGNNCLAGVTASFTAAGVLPAVAVTAGTTYYIVVSTNGAPQTTPYTLTLQQVNCTPPTGLTTGGLTSSSANLSWAAGTATAWQIAVQPAGAGLPLTAGQNVTQNTNVNVTSTTAGTPFTSATAYEYYVRANCGDGTYSIWSGPFAFSTTQIPIPMDYSENFDGPAAHGYTILNGTQVNKWYVGAATSASATNSLYISNDNSITNAYTINAPSVVHAYRDIQVPVSPGQVSVSFDLKAGGQSATDYIRVWLVPTSFIPTPGTQITTASGGVQIGGNFHLTPAWTTQNIVFDATALGNSTRRLIFEWRNDASVGAQPAGAIDNVYVKKVTCAAPSALTLTSSTTSTATYTWTAPTGTPPAGYDYYYSLSPSNPTPSTPEMGTVTTPTTTIGPLNSSDTYYMWVRSSCGTTNKSFWIGPVAVLVSQVANSLPYSQNFDGATNGFSVLNGTQPNKWVVGSATSSSPSKSLYISNDNGVTNAYEGTLCVSHAFRDITIPPGTSQIDIAFDFKCVGETVVSTPTDYLRVWMVPNSFIPTPGIQITAAAAGAGDRIKVGGDMNKTLANGWVTMNLDTPVGPYQNTTRRLVFEWRNDANGVFQTPAAIDNINITVAGCPKPINLAAINVTNTNATLDWTEGGSATSWEVAYMPEAGATVPTTTGIPVSGNSEYTPPVGTFVYGTQYVYYVRSMCGGANGASTWAGPYSFALVPVNDNCTSATTVLTNTDLSCTNAVNGSVFGATQSSQANGCSGTADDDVWYEFVATNTSHHINLNNVAGSTLTLYYTVYSGSCGTLTQVQCVPAVSNLITNLVVGQTYKVRVFSFTNTPQTSTFQFCITTPPLPPVNDECVTAITLPVNPTLVCEDSMPGTVYSATASSQPITPCTGTADDDIWYKFVATNTTHRVVVHNVINGTSALSHSVYAGTSCTALTQQYCSTGLQSWANNLTIGQTYYIRIYSTANAPVKSEFFVCVSTPPPPPANDECATAITVPVNPSMICEDSVSGTLLSSSASPENNLCSNTADDDDVWYEFTATSTAHIVEFKNVEGSTTDIYHAVYVGDVCGTLTQLYCSDPNFSVAAGLTVGQTYKIRVWTTSAVANQTTSFLLCVSTPPPPPANDDCANAMVIPVNQNANCTLSATSSLYGSTASPENNLCGNQNSDDDVWFKFTATNTTHLVSLDNITGGTTDLYHAVYSGDQCNALTQLYCSDANYSTATGLVIGNTYKIRVYSNVASPGQTSQFNVCVRIPNTPVTVSPAAYTIEELVSEVLINSECALVSNITSKSQADFGGEPSIAYFDANGSTFPFSYGVVLATSNAQLAQGPFAANTNTSTPNATGWTGDNELNNIVVANDPLQIKGTQNASIIEFDFVPLINKFSFDFLFASTEYGLFQCNYTDVFAFILTDPDGNKQNLAVLPNTNIPVSVSTIRDGQYNTNCGSQNVEYFGQYNNNVPAASAINFNGQTTALTAQADVIPGETYHIKLVIADYNDYLYSSAIFLGGGTFDIGELDMGGDLLVSLNNAVCDAQSTTLSTDLAGDQYNYSWYKDGVIIDDATAATYDVTEPGTYGVQVTMDNISCSYEGSVIVEFYDPVNNLTGDPVNLTQCDASGFHVFDITSNMDELTANVTNLADFTTSVHLTEQDAINGINAIDPATYASFTNTVEDLQTLWTRTVYAVTGCFGIKPFDLIVQDLTPVYTIDSDFSICDGTSDTIDIVITDTDPNPVTYTWTKDGAPLPDITPSITVTEAGAYTVVLDRTGCATSSTVNVVVTPIPVADDPADVTICDNYTLPALSAGNGYFATAANGGASIPVGEIITATTDIVVRAESGTTPNCTSENTFTVTIIPSPVVAAPADQTACETYTLPELTEGGNYYTGSGKTGTVLNAGDAITSTQTIYVYEETGTTPNCWAETSFEVTIVTKPEVDTPTDVNACDSYELPALTLGNYYTGTNGSGEALPAGYIVTASQPVYVFADNGVCTNEHLFNVIITPTPAFSLGGPYVSCLASNVTITITDANFTETDNPTYAWTADGVPVVGGSSIIASVFGTYEVTVTVNNCSHSESIEVTENETPVALIITEGCENGAYMVGVSDQDGSFNPDTATYSWTGPNSFSSDKQKFVATTQGEYFVTVTTPEGCIGEDSIIVSSTSCEIQRGISPNNDGANDYFDLTELMVKHLNIFNRYGQEVYSKDNYTNEWTGQTNKGDELPTGTYFYMIELMNGESKTGWIYINRQN